MTKKILTLSIISLLLSACGQKSTPIPTPTPAPRIFELNQNDRPVISLIPRTDGHELELSLKNIPSSIQRIEYELLYTAVDNGMEIEKGVGDTIKDIGNSISRKLLLGTSSCTNGCKYKYDTGVTGGTLSLTLINQSGQAAMFETPFVIRTGAQIKKESNQITLDTENYSHSVSNPKNNSFYILIKNFGGQESYSLFESGSF